MKIQRHQRLIHPGSGNSPGKFYDLFALDGDEYAVYGKVGTMGKAIKVDYDKQLNAKLAKGYSPDGETGLIAAGLAKARVAAVAQQFGLDYESITVGALDENQAAASAANVRVVERNVGLCTIIDRLAGSDSIALDCVMEQKLDGHRLLISSEETGLEFYNRAGQKYSKAIPPAVQSLEIPVGWVIDGELVGDEYWAFDILHNERDVASHPLFFRRQLLEGIAEKVPGLKVIPQAKTAEEMDALLRYVVASGAEGVVVKESGSAYPKGRSRDWGKYKITPTSDVIVLAVRDDGKESAALGIFQGGNLVEVGRCSLIGKPDVVVGDVVEVKYLNFTDNGRLYQPTMVRVRNDKLQQECDGKDLRAVDKTVLSELPKDDA